MLESKQGAGHVAHARLFVHRLANVMNQMRHGYLAVRECPDPPSVRMRGIGVRVAEYDDVTNVGCRHPPCRAPHSFTAPIMIPLTKYRCTNGYTSAIGTTTTTRAAYFTISTGMLRSSTRSREMSPRLLVIAMISRR